MTLNTNVINKTLVCVSILYFSLTFFFLNKHGINTQGEATKYITDANGIINLQPLHNGVFSYFYFSYSLFIAFFIKANISLYFVAVFQIIFSFVAAVFLYHLILKVTKQKYSALSGFILYLFCYPIQKWLLFLYTESFHTSLITIGFCLFFNYWFNKTLKNILLFIVVLFFILTSRPVGIIFLLTSCVIILIFYFKQANKKTAILLFLVSIIGLIFLLNSPLTYFINADSLRRQEIICQVPQVSNLPYTEYNTTGLIGAFKVIKNEIGFKQFFYNGYKKIGSFFGLVRPHFSFSHNLFLSVYYILYFFSIVAIFFYKNVKFSMVKVFSITYVALTTIGIFFTCDDWSDRFIAPIFPFIILFACLGLSKVFVKQ